MKIRPRVVANFARTADGKISTREHTPSGFGSARDLRRLLEIRAGGDAVVVGRNTLASDRMSMTLRDDDLRAGRVERGCPAEPLRVVLSNRGNLDPGWKLFQTDGAPRVIFTTTAMPSTVRAALEPLAEIHTAAGESVDLADVLSILRKRYAVRTLVCEGGPTLFRSLLAAGAMDLLHLTVVPVIFGGADAPTLTGLPSAFFPSPIPLRLKSMETVDGECFLTYRVCKPAAAS